MLSLASEILKRTFSSDFNSCQDYLLKTEVLHHGLLTKQISSYATKKHGNAILMMKM